MNKLLLKLFSLVFTLSVGLNLSAQTSGTLTFTFTEVAKPTSSCYNFNAQHVLAAWIQTSTGAFVKTKLRYVGAGTNDHLPTWASNASCTSGIATSSGCNTLDGTTGATRASWATYVITWDGKKGATATGTLQPDGVYKVTLQSTWNHGTGGTALTTYTFTKGPNVDHQTPVANTTFSNITLDWQPNTTGIEEISAPEMSVYPNPTTGVFNVDYAKANHIKVFSTLGVIVYDEKLEEELSTGTKTINLNSCANGIYMISISNDKGLIYRKVILDK